MKKQTTIEKSNDITKQWSDYFKSLTKPQQRVAIALDVIASVKKGTYITDDVYVVLYPKKGINMYEIGELDFQKNMDKIESCTVCGVGACLVSLIKYTNNATIEELNDYDGQWDKLAKYFSPKQLMFIEGVFEDVYNTDPGDCIGMASCDLNYNVTKSDANILNEVNEKNLYSRNRDKRMIAIMENIVRNKGMFLPLQG